MLHMQWRCYLLQVILAFTLARMLHYLWLRLCDADIDDRRFSDECANNLPDVLALTLDNWGRSDGGRGAWLRSR